MVLGHSFVVGEKHFLSSSFAGNHGMLSRNKNLRYRSIGNFLKGMRSEVTERFKGACSSIDWL